MDSSDGAAISPRPLSGLVCATEVGATSPNLTYWLSPDRIYIQSQGREGGEEGVNQSQVSRSRQYRQENERTPTEWMWSGLVPPCQAKLSLTKTGEKAKRAKEREREGGGRESARERERERRVLWLPHSLTYKYTYVCVSIYTHADSYINHKVMH